jgi:hypothetical protein
MPCRMFEQISNQTASRNVDEFFGQMLLHTVLELAGAIFEGLLAALF